MVKKKVRKKDKKKSRGKNKMKKIEKIIWTAIILILTFIAGIVTADNYVEQKYGLDFATRACKEQGYEKFAGIAFVKIETDDSIELKLDGLYCNNKQEEPKIRIK